MKCVKDPKKECVCEHYGWEQTDKWFKCSNINKIKMNTSRWFGLISFIVGVILIFLVEILKFLKPEYVSDIKWWHIGLLMIGGLLVWVFTDEQIRSFGTKWINKKLRK